MHELVPAYFATFAHNSWKDEGDEWIARLEGGLIDDTLADLGVDDATVQNDLTMNLIMSGHSKQHGTDVFVKFGNPTQNTRSEMAYMRLASQSIPEMAPCLSIDEDERVIVMESLSPGYGLDEADRGERVSVAARMSHATSIPCAPGDLACEMFGSFREEMLGKMDMVDSSPDGSEMSRIKGASSAARRFDADVESAGLGLSVIHGDLHCGNILRAGDGWKVIDPMGVIAEEAFSTCKFASHELVDSREPITEMAVKSLLDDLAAATEVNRQLLYRAFHVDVFDWLEFSIRAHRPRETQGRLLAVADITEGLVS